MTTATVNRVLAVTQLYLRERTGDLAEDWTLGPDSAVCQDAFIFGVDVEDYVSRLDAEFGSVVWLVPWLCFTDQTSSFRGCAVAVAPFWIVWRALCRLFRSGPVVPRPNPAGFPHRLTFAHIAAVIDRGECFEP